MYLSNKLITISLKSFISGTAFERHHIFNTFLRSKVASKTSFHRVLSLKTKQPKLNDCLIFKKHVLEVLLAAFLKKRIAALIATKNRFEALNYKVRQLFITF